jgi:Glycosyltransferase family 9 (heptosyltransferase)
MAKNILFLHDTSLMTPRGAELTIKELIALGNEKNYTVDLDNLKDFESVKKRISQADLVVLNSTSRCHFELDLLNYLISQTISYIKVEYDYNFCIRRNILCTVDHKIRSCCHPDKFHLFRKLFQGSALNVFQSPKHYESHYEFYGEAVSGHLIMPPTVDVEHLQPSEHKNDDIIPFFGDLNYLKGGDDYIIYANQHPDKKFTVYGNNQLRRDIPDNVTFQDPIKNTEVLKILGRTKQLICKPVWPEPSGRLVAEAFLSGCEIISNERIGTFSFDFYPDDKQKAAEEMMQAPENFWCEVENIFDHKSDKIPTSLGNVLVYKSYGGLGDIFFAIPAIYKLAKVSNELHFAVAPRLVDFFKQHLVGVKVVNEEAIRKQESKYDNIYELGNYPAFRGYDLPHALKYPTHKKVKQHAIGHYIDTVSKLHKNIDNHLVEYPYFKKTLDDSNQYFVVHHGAGFLLKIWPTEKYAELIEKLHDLFPNLGCKIIMGPNDPDIQSLFTKKMPHVEYITGGMEDVGEALSGALFHIGNDAGITHVAGTFNVPTVGVYGPTGPGSWGSFAEHNELIWGKQGVCNLRCNYDVILNCEHRICLTSVTVNRVLSALYKVLQRAYRIQQVTLKINPMAAIEFTKTDCLIKLNDNDLLLEYHSASMKKQVEAILTEQNVSEIGDIKLVIDVLKKQEILFEVPIFS